MTHNHYVPKHRYELTKYFGKKYPASELRKKTTPQLYAMWFKLFPDCEACKNWQARHALTQRLSNLGAI